MARRCGGRLAAAMVGAVAASSSSSWVLHAAMAQEKRNYTNIVVTEEGGWVATSVQSASSQALPEGTLELYLVTSVAGFDGQVVVAGPSSLYGSLGAVNEFDSLDKARELRHAATLFAQWLNSERGGLRVAGKRLALALQWVDDGNSRLQVANATARTLRMPAADFAIAGYSSRLTKYSAMQARADGKLMIVAGAGSVSIFKDESYQEHPVVFGFLPPGRTQFVFERIACVAEEVDAGRLNAVSVEVCGSAGCRAQLRYAHLGCKSWKKKYAEKHFAAYVGCEFAGSATISFTPEELRLALGRLQAKNVTVLEACRFSTAQLKILTEIMEELGFNVFALIAISSVLSPDFERQAKHGWWQSAHILDVSPWNRVAGAPGSFSGITSQDFVDRYYAAFGARPGYLGAAQFGALCALCAAVEAADSLDSRAVAAQLQNLSLSEFYGQIGFLSTGQLLPRHFLLQAPQADPLLWDVEVVASGSDERTQRFVFPRPPWPQQRCRYESKNADGKECSGNGKCGLGGACICHDTWQGSSCDLSLTVVTDSSAKDQLSVLRNLVIGAAASVVCILVACTLAFNLYRRRYRHRLQLEASYLQQLEAALENDAHDHIHALKRRLSSVGWTPSRFDTHLQGIRRRNSEAAGVGVAYLLSQDFLDLAQARSGKNDPTFYDLKDAFFFSDAPIGADAICPRDGKPGTALVDTLPPEHRRQCTHFLSWTWGYKLSTVRGGLRRWLRISDLRAEDVFIYMCFYVNNQYRILVSSEKTDSDELERCFENNLKRIGNVVALLDTWDNPRYLTRIWTIFEQMISIKLGIPVTMVLPEQAAEELLLEIEQGKSGILRVRDALTKVDSKQAKAFSFEDEEAVKGLIQRTFDDGFGYVDDQIIQFMIRWMGYEIESHMKSLVTKGEAASSSCLRAAVESSTEGVALVKETRLTV